MSRWTDILRASHRCTARHDIADVPTAEVDCSAKRGDVGLIDDYDACADLFYVTFRNGGSIACEPQELAP